MLNLFTKNEVPVSAKEPQWTDLSVEEVLDIFDIEVPAQAKELEEATYLKDKLGYYNLFNTLQRKMLKSALIKGGIKLLNRKSVDDYKAKTLWVAGAGWEWDWQDISGYRKKIPQPILRMIIKVDEIIKASGIQDVTMAVEGLYRKEKAADPFILVEHKLGPIKPPNGFWCDQQDELRGQGFHRWPWHPLYFGVWDEPDFKGRYYLPTEEL